MKQMVTEGEMGLVIFRVLIGIGAIVPAVIAYGARAIPMYGFGLFLANCVPLGVAWWLYHFVRRSTGWGCAISVIAFMVYIWIDVTYFPTSSTGSIAFIWLPFWNSLAVGPAGALIGYAVGHLFSNRQSAR